MARPSYGPRSKNRASRLFEGLLAYANDAWAGYERLHPYIQVHWRTEQQLVVRTKVRFLEELTAKDPYTGKLTGQQIKEALKRFEDFLEILEDNRPSTQGSDVWHFTLHLWYERQDRVANLQQFDQEWERRRPTKSKQVTREQSNNSQPGNGLSINLTSTAGQKRQDWGEALDVSIFYGRETEINTLTQWVLNDRCKLITLLGMGGMGKTTLSVKLAEQIQEEFEFLFWRSLRNAPPAEEILTESIHFLSNYQDIDLPATLEGKISHLLNYLRRHRCLLLLDNTESVLQGGTQAGHFQTGYEGYGHLLRCVEEGRHQSCVVCTSREKPKGIAFREGVTLPIRSLQLKGLTQTEGQGIFEARGCFGVDEQAWREIFEHFAGNPLALKIVASTVQELFEGDVAELMPYLRQKVLGFEDIRDLLQQQFNRLSALEQQVMYWLAVNRDPIALTDLETDVVSGVVSRQLLEVLNSLGRRCLVERNEGQWLLQPVVMEYVTNRLIEQVCCEIRDWGEGIWTGRAAAAPQSSIPNPQALSPTFNPLPPTPLFNSHALVKAQSKDYVRQAQVRLILRPVLDRLLAMLGSQQRIEQQLRRILAQLREDAPLQPGYAGGNILNLLCELNADLSQLDCSSLAIWQAHLVGVDLHHVNFAHADLAKSVFTDTLSATLAVAFSRDGALFATGNADGEVRVWQAVDGQKLLIFKGHRSWAAAVAFSPNGQFLASGSFDQTIKLWDLSTGECLKTLRGHTSWVWSVAFSPDGWTLASGGHDHQVKLWNLATGECTKTFQEHTGTVWSVAFSPDGRILASGSDDHTARLWDINRGESIKILRGHTSWVRAIAFSAGGRNLVTASKDSTIRVWDIASGECLKTLKGHTNLVTSVGLSSNGATIASGSQDCTVRLWDTVTGECIKTLKGHPTGVWSIAFHTDNQTLISGSNDSTVKLWNTQTGQSLRTFQGYSSGVKAVNFSPDGYTLASGGDDKTISLWDVQSGDCRITLSGHRSWIWDVVFSRDGQTLASSSNDRTLRLWTVQTGECVKVCQEHTNLVMSVAFSPDDQSLASGSSDQTVKVWDVHTGECLKTLSHMGRVWSVAYLPQADSGAAPTDQLIASGSDEKDIKLWHVKTGECVSVLPGNTGLVFAVAFSPEGRFLASSSDDAAVMLWHVKSGERLKTLTGHVGAVWSVAFSSDGQILASCGNDRTVRLWDVQSGECLKTLKGHTGEVWSIAFSPLGSTLASGSQDGTVKLWDISTGECLNTLRAIRPYEAMNITAVTSLTEAQKETLKRLGAVERAEH